MTTPKLTQKELMEYAHKIRDYQHAQFIKEGYLVGSPEMDASIEHVRKMKEHEASSAQRYGMSSAYYNETFTSVPSGESVLLDNELIKSTTQAHVDQIKMIASRYTDGVTIVIDDARDNDVSFPPDNNDENIAFYICYTLYAFSKSASNVDAIPIAPTTLAQ